MSLDAYVDYSGTLWATVLGHGEPRPPRAQLLDQISQELEDRFGVQVVAALGSSWFSRNRTILFW